MKDKYIEIRTGSDSDISKIKEIYSILDHLEIPYSARILSAHRTPLKMIEEAQNLEENGFKVSVCAAGGSAHLAGMTASESSVPVVALPVKSSLGGEDALLSMAQMPPGIPNGTVGIGEAYNAGILATRIAYLDNHSIREKLSSTLDTKIKSELGKSPTINIISSFPQERLAPYINFAKTFGMGYSINDESISPVAIYIDSVAEISKTIEGKTEQVSIIAPLEKEFNLCSLPDLIKGPYAWMGVNRVNNSIIYAAQILGIYFPEVKEKFKTYRKKLSDEVKTKDENLREKGVELFPSR
ncbi:5-(carboxyamino)imidazole ribonucleotide mutase [Bacteroidota bacterium]